MHLKEVDSKVFRMAIHLVSIVYGKKRKMENGQFSGFLFGMRSNIPAFIVRVFTSDFNLNVS